MCEKRERMVTVTDDWHPCFDGNKVRLRLGLYFFKNYYVKLSAWGADDTGVEIEHTCQDYSDAVHKFAILSSVFDYIPDEIDRAWFLDHGFVPA